MTDLNEPDQAAGGNRKEHPCPDCRMCQNCAEVRCNVCRSEKPPEPKLSFAEQIALYEKLNAEE